MSGTKVLIFCRFCQEIIAEVQSISVPYKLQCPSCGHVERVYWLKHWNGKVGAFNRWMIATSSKGKLGFMLRLQFPVSTESNVRVIGY